MKLHWINALLDIIRSFKKDQMEVTGYGPLPRAPHRGPPPEKREEMRQQNPRIPSSKMVSNTKTSPREPIQLELKTSDSAGFWMAFFYMDYSFTVMQIAYNVLHDLMES